MERQKKDVGKMDIGKVRTVDKVWLSQSEAKAYLDIKDTKTLDRLAREYMLEVCVLGRKLVYYSKRGIDSMLERNAFVYEGNIK